MLDPRFDNPLVYTLESVKVENFKIGLLALYYVYGLLLNWIHQSFSCESYTNN